MKKHMINFNSAFLICALSFGFVSCEQNPYPNTGEVRITQRQEEKPVEPPLAIAVDDVIEYREGRSKEYQIRVAVRDSGKAVVNIDNLPAGATFDPETFVLKWTPNNFNGNDPKDPTIKSRIYPITIWLRNSEDQVRALKKVVNLVVYDVPQNINIEPDFASTVSEGQTYINTIKISNADFPTGPFKVVVSGVPSNTTLTKVNENSYRLTFSPDYYHVNIAKNGQSLTYTPKIVVTNPANHTFTKDISLQVFDVRLSPKLVVPQTITSGLDTTFQVVGYDTNKEVTPKIKMISTAPNFGRLTFSEQVNEESQSSVLNVFWNDIPPAFNGKEVQFTFDACVLSSQSRMDLCERSTSTVKIIVRDRKAPLIQRADWAIGELIYLNHSETVNKRIFVRDLEDSKLKPKVEIFPEEMRKYVSWSNDSLRMNFTEPGTFQFNIKATSDYNISSAESFLVEVFPKDRNKTLFFADSTRDPEVKFYRSTFKNVDLMNPAIQDINLRSMSGRETLVLGTSILQDPELGSVLNKAIGLIKNVVVASPLIDQLPQEFLDKLKNDYGLITIGRLSQLPNMPNLSELRFAKTKQFQDSLNPIYLNGNASKESSDPMFFNGGLYEPDKTCKGILGLSKDGNNPYVIGVVCNRENGGKISLLGTEWADLKVSTGDEQIPVQWFNTMIKGKF